MPFQPSQYQVLDADRRLTQLSIAIMADTSNYVSGAMFPTVSVNQQAGKFITYNSGDFNKTEMRPTADGAPAPLAKFGYGEDNYFCDVYKEGAVIGERTLANAYAPMQPRQEMTTLLSRHALIDREQRFHDTFLKAGVWTADLNGATTDFVQFDAAGGTGNPIELITEQSTAFALRNYGVRPNRLTMSRNVFDELKNHPDIIERIIYIAGSEPAMINSNHLSQLFEMQVVVSNSVYNTANEGAADSKAFFSTNEMLMSYAPATPGLMTSSAGYIFSWTALSGYGGTAVRSEARKMSEGGGEYMEIQAAYDMKVINADMGTYFSNVVA